jgi:PAS domain-containing protein
MGRDFGDLWAENVQCDFPKTFEAFKKAGKVRNELALRRRDGTIVHAMIDGRVQRDQNGEFLRTHCILTDITERTLAAQREAARLEQLKTLQNSA